MAWLLSLLIQDKSPFSVTWVILDVAKEDGHLWWRLMAARFFIVFFFQFEFVWLILINEIKRYNYIIIITTICHVIIVIYHLSYSLLFIELFTFVSVRHLSLEWKTRLNEFSSFYREPFIIAAPTGLIETSTTLLEGRLGLTNRKPSWPSTGTYLSLRSVLAWKSMNSSGLLSSTSSWLFVLTDRRWAIPRNLTASWYVENAYWCSCFFAKQM